MKLRIEKLARHHTVTGFDCANEPLNRFFQRFALANQQANASQTYLGLAEDAVVGEVSFDAAPTRLTKWLARHPFPIMLIARLAVSMDWQSKGPAPACSKTRCCERSTPLTSPVSVRSLCTPRTKVARAFYEHFDFVQSPSDPLHLFVLIKDLARTVSR